MKFLVMIKALIASHTKLLMKVESCGIKTMLLTWFSCYLTSRIQVMNETLPKPRPINSEHIQGSLLVPILFLLCVNDMFPMITQGILFLSSEAKKVCIHLCIMTLIPP